ncbi:EF-hand calcium-binding domain-containing protein 5-like isoform X3 [Mytilus californianus]|uniref:EF-hand calcium-binding domain-containing protein 5-like isoform X3 n=1 Tax=Mytilus californianus TaxID=6549 RepID=UPI002246FAD3|nr:EF-hand calcium-binding domain-containing protein 5-like isoform X3 [Mytilus californianus]
MADVLTSKPGSGRTGSPTKRVTMTTPQSPGRQSMTPGSGKHTPTGSDYMKPVVRSAVRRWKRLHEQNMMEKLVGMRNEKKNNTRSSRDDARKMARKIPTEILAKQWLNDNEATLEVRAYLVDKVLPTLILGVEKLLTEADKKGLTEENEEDPDFNPINFLAQYLLRNNPKYSNFSEASPYVRGLREVADELRKQLFNIEDNRLARIKAEAKRRREEREKLEEIKQKERERRENCFMDQFREWNSLPEGKVELSLVQNALRSFSEIAEATFPEELRDAAKLSRSLEATDESGKCLTVKDFAKYLSAFVEDLTRDLFDEFMKHLAKCAVSYRAATQEENRRIALSNLFISCDHSGIGLLDRHRILSLFENFWDTVKDNIKMHVRNPRRWPVVEVDEVEDTYDDDEEIKPEQETEQKSEVPAPSKETTTVAESTDEVKTEQKPQTPPPQQQEVQTPPKQEEQKPTTPPPQEKQKTEESLKPEESKSDEIKPTEEAEKQEETKPSDASAEVAKPTDTESSKAEESKPTEEEASKPTEEVKGEESKPTEEVKGEESKPTEEVKGEEQAPAEPKTETEKSEVKPTQEQESVKEEPKTEDTKEKEPEKTEGEKTEGDSSKTEEVKSDDTKASETSENVPEEKKEEEPKTDNNTDVKEASNVEKTEEVKTSSEDISVSREQSKESIHSETTNPLSSVKFAEGTTFDRERTVMTARSQQSGTSAFDENVLNVSQFVQLTETFLCKDEKPKQEAFVMLAKFIKEGYEETEEEKMDRLIKARKEALSSQRKHMMDQLFEKWDNDGSGFLDLEDVEGIMVRYKDGQENEAINKAKTRLKKTTKYAQDNRLSKREFRTFVQAVTDEISGADSFDYYIDFLTNSVERTYAERIRGEARKKWLQQVVSAAETSGASMEPVYKSVFQALYKDSEAHGNGKKISSNIAMLERNRFDQERGEVCLRYVAATIDDADFLLGKILYKDMKGISFASVERGQPIHVPRVANHGNVQFWNPYRLPEDREGSFIVVPLKDKRKRVFGLIGVDTLNDRHSKTIFITHEIQYFQGVAKAFSIAYHHIDMRKKLLRITESAVSWIHRRNPHVHEISTYMVEPDGKEKQDYVLRKMMNTDAKGNVQNLINPPRLERKDNLFRDYLFKTVDTSESISADAYGERHLAFPLRDDNGKAIAVVDISIGETKILPTHENKEVQRMLRLLQQAHKEITREFAGDDKNIVLEAERDDENRMDIMFDRLMLMELRENVSKIDAKAFAELRSYNDPPKIVVKIVKAVSAIFFLEKVQNGELDDWTNLRTYMNNDLLQKIAQYDPTAAEDHQLIPPEKIEVHLKDVPHGEVSKFGSVPAQHMYNWVFVCISLIEHTLKMRENDNSSVLK